MTVKQWLLIVAICLVVYMAPQFLPEPEGAEKFTYLASVSLLSLWLILSVSTTKTAWLAAAIEFLAIIVNAIAYKIVGDSAILFHQYVLAIDGLALLQALIILIGAPWNGMAHYLKHVRVANILWYTNLPRSVSVDRCDNGEIS